jgi:hypothetical protein
VAGVKILRRCDLLTGTCMHTVWARERSGENVQRGRAGADSACGMGAESQCVCG